MAAIKTINFLPEVFRTNTNQKFLNATLDQLVTPPDLRKVNAYIGRKFAPTFKSTDNYQPEPTTLRQNYQLEPSVVVKDKTTGDINFFSSYVDLINQLKHDGAYTENQNRLFKSETYSFDGLFDFDKFVNFNQYYWLPTGPDPVQVFGSGVEAQATYTVTRDPSTGSYHFTGSGDAPNPILRLARGGTYKFIVNQPGYPFWIQSSVGTSGLKTGQSNLSSRDVLGVDNNGAEVGTITFNVPQTTAQDYYVYMPLVATVDLATDISYTNIQNHLLSTVVQNYKGIDNVISQLSNKTLIFVNKDIDDALWTAEGLLDRYGYDVSGGFDGGGMVPAEQRRGVWRLQLIPIDGDYIVNLVPDTAVGVNQRVFVAGGQTHAEETYYLNADFGYYTLVPNITASLPTIFYQDGVGSKFVGEINLVDINDNTLNVDKDIIGAKNYTSPNGVSFTNGLKITFDSSASPIGYAGNTYYVEGVGTAIKLLNVTDFITPETYADNGITTPDYITVNRASQDLNPWSRSNRWFHIDVIKAVAAYNNAPPTLEQRYRASRAIIEFEADLQLYNFGRQAKTPIDIFDNTITDARNSVELNDYFVLDGVVLKDGMRVVFANDFDPTVRGQIFNVNLSSINEQTLVTLSPAEDSYVAPNSNLIVLQGNTHRGKQYWYDGSNWIEGQQKVSVNQTPMFDVVDGNGISLGDSTAYPGSTFATTKNNLGTAIGGTPIFSYKVGTGTPDQILGFPLSYRTFNQVGDIQFVNNFDSDKFSYTGVVDQNINTAGTLQQNNSLTAYNLRNAWLTATETSKQYQVINGIYDGTNPYFRVDVVPYSATTVPYIKVYKNFAELPPSKYQLGNAGVNYYVHVKDSTMVAGDQIDIAIYGNNVSALGYYQVPTNLDFNSENANFDTLTLGQLRNHLVSLVSNSTQVTGSGLGENNLRDVPIKAQGGNILQNASPVLYSELFLVDTDANFIKGLELARHNYGRIKNKILETATNLKSIVSADIPGTLDKILQGINSVKNNTFPWYYSDMVPYGPLKNVITYTVVNAEQSDYEITNIFSDTQLSNRAVLVYINDIQQTLGTDYQFDTTRAGITFLKTLNYGDVITINEYNNTDGNYIPETPTKLGLYPKFKPGILIDNTYREPVTVIQGHDGSITPSFGDFRDQLLLEFELRIYNNIKVDHVRNTEFLYNYLPGKFRRSDYSNREFTQLLTRSFLQWAGSNRVDFTTNSYFESSDPFTWNYSKFVDTVNGEALPGTWRAIFNYFYDTDRPHTHPWEMLGISEEPSWWQGRYGPAPYTGGNLVLWNDLALGYVWNNGSPYTDPRFVRPNLLNIIPVDENGILRSPTSYIVKSFNSNQANGSYNVGQQGPVETAWRRSSDYPYAVQEALALAAPAYYFGSLMDVTRYYKNSDLNQFVLADTLQRITPSAVRINGQQIDNSTSFYRVAGYINWISDYLRSIGIDPVTKITGYLNNVSVQLGYKMAGYSDASFLEVLAEQASPTSTTNSIVVPNENYKIQLYKSTPVQTITYSAVIVEKSENGYTVSGYDTSNPYFTIIPSLANNNAYTITALNDVGVIYNDYQKYKVTVPYGFEFNNKQQVVDFLVSYERFLRGSGVAFTDFDSDLNLQRDFKLSAQEFLTWSQQGWTVGSVLVLSPILSHLVVNVPSGVVDQVENTPLGSRILDTGYNFIKYNAFSVTRTDNNFTVTAINNQTIALAVLDVVEYEHVLIFDNITAFNDVIYVPTLGNRQYRLKLVGQKTGSWTGALNPPGFIYNSPKVDAWQPGKDYALGSLVTYKNSYYTATQSLTATTTFNPSEWQNISSNQLHTGLLPNFSYNSGKAQRFNSLTDPELQGDFSRFVGTEIGFRPRQYLTNFGIDIPTQAQFYQGYIRQKGTMNSVTAFTAAGFNGVNSTINLYEEWAMRVGEYGALHNNQFVELELVEGTFNGDPVTFTLLPNNVVNVDHTISVYPANLYLTSDTYSPSIFQNRDESSFYENDILTAGYVKKDDIDIQIFDMASYGELNQHLNQISVGKKIWAAKDNTTTSWNVYRVTETNLSVVSFAYSVDVMALVTTLTPHSFVYGDIIVVRGFDDRINGFYQVYNVVDAYSFTVVVPATMLDTVKSAGAVLGLGPVYKLVSLRLKNSTDLTALTPPNEWIDGDKLWSDYDQNTGGWVVYNKSTPWTTANTDVLNNISMELDANSYVTNSGFGTVTAINPTATFAAASMPTLNNGNVIVFVSNVANNNTFTMVGNLGQRSGGTLFGSSLSASNNLLYIGHPGDGATQAGRVHIHKFNGVSSFPWSQTLTSPTTANGDNYGYSVSASDDGTWLYVGAPGVGNVYVYHSNTTGYYSLANTIVGNNYVSTGNAIASQFGYTVNTTSDGAQTIVGAPYERVNGVAAAGAVYVYNRSQESFVANGGNVYYPQFPISTSTVKVTVNGTVQNSGFTAYTGNVSFTQPPVVGTIITVDTNEIQLLEKLTSPAPTSGGAFGIVSHIAGNDADIYVASPGYSEPGYHSGIVYRFVNSGANYGTITSTVADATVVSGNNFYINGCLVQVSGTTLANVATAINSANIAGVSAVAQDYGYLTINSTVTTPFEKLIIAPGTGTILTDMGLSTFANVQALKHPGKADVNAFGSQITSNKDSTSLVISASRGASFNMMSFDKITNETYFDTGSTAFHDGIEGSGVVFIYGLVEGSLSVSTPDQYVLVQQLQNTSLSSNDQFGTSLALAGNVLLVGAPGDSNHVGIDPLSERQINIPSAGTYYTYNNFTGNIGWDIINSQQPKVDLDSITRMYIYNKSTQTLLTNFDYIDPAKGKVLGAAQEDLDYITAYDPAIYNAAVGVGENEPNLSVNNDYHWGAEQVTKTWWDIGKVRYYDYEQGNLTYRSNNWGSTFPGSKIQVAEWVMSAVPPSQYKGSGTPLYPDNSAYVIESYVDPVSKLLRSRYYYWVINKATREIDSNHINSINTIQDIIANPAAQAIPYAAVLRDDTISLYNVSDYLIGSGNTIVFHADHDSLKNTNIIHNEYQLIQEGRSGSFIPDRIIKKMIDSLSGTDILGNPVPDVSLTPQTKLGIGTSPNQTIFVDRLTALENFVQYVNNVLIQYPIVEEYNINGLYSSDPQPGIENYDYSVNNYAELTYIDTAGLLVGYTVLVKQDENNKGLWATYSWAGTTWTLVSVQSYYTPFYWSFVNWYDTTYDSTGKVTYQVATYPDLVTLSPGINDTAKVLNRGNGQFSIYRWNGSAWNLVGLENGTIQLNSNLYTTTVASNEIRIIFNAIQNNIFVDNLKSHFNDLFFFMINYVLTEQKSVDWVFKTSFVTIFHQLRELIQYPSFIQDNQTYYENYINEVKPYRTSIREYLINYNGTDEYYGDTTDFDIPATYISNVNAYRSPNGTVSSDAYALANLPQYSSWYNNHGYGIASVKVSNPGSGYYLPPVVNVIGGGGTGAVVTADVDITSNTISRFNVINPGSGYTSTPTISIVGTGTGAVGYPTLIGQHYVARIPTLDITLDSNTHARAGDIITQPATSAAGVVYSATAGGNVLTLKDVNLIDVTGTFKAGEYLYLNATPLNVRPGVPTTTLTVNGNVNLKAGDILLQSGSGAQGEVYADTTTNTVKLWNVSGTFLSGRWLSKAGSNIAVYPTFYTVESGASPFNLYTTLVDESYNKIRTFDTTIKFDRVSYSSNVTAWSKNDSYSFLSDFDQPGDNWDELPFDGIISSDWVRYNGKGYEAVGVVYSSATLKLSGNISANIGDYVTQLNTEANAQIISISSNNSLITVSNVTSNFVRRNGNIAINGVVTNVNPVAVNNIFDYTQFRAIGGEEFSTAADRISASYIPSANMPGLDMKQLMSGMTYPGVRVDGLKYNATSSVITSNVVAFFTTNATMISSNIAKLNFTTFGLETRLPLTVTNTDTDTTANVKILSIAPDKMVLNGVMSNIALGSNVSIVYFDSNNPIYLDTIIQSSYLDTALGTRAEDINIDGGAYYDIYSSHAPEELVPGITFDNLNIKVTTRLHSNTTPVSYRIVHNMNTNAAAIDYSLWPQYYAIFNSNTTTLTANLNITDANIHVTNANVFMTPNPNTYPPTPGVVYINGEKITYWTIDRHNNVLGQIRRAVDGTGAPQVHAIGSLVEESSVNQLLPTSTVANVHTTSWLNGPTVPSAEVIIDTVGDTFTQDLPGTVNIIRFLPGAQEFITLSTNVAFAAGDTITQPATGATAIVSGSIAQVQANLGTIVGNTISVLATSVTGTFDTTEEIPANSYVWKNGANVVAQVTGISFNITDGYGLERSTTIQAQFIRNGV